MHEKPYSWTTKENRNQKENQMKHETGNTTYQNLWMLQNKREVYGYKMRFIKKTERSQKA